MEQAGEALWQPESQHDEQSVTCPTLLAVAMKHLCAHCGQGIRLFKEDGNMDIMKSSDLGTFLVVQWLIL